MTSIIIADRSLIYPDNHPDISVHIDYAHSLNKLPRRTDGKSQTVRENLPVRMRTVYVDSARCFNVVLHASCTFTPRTVLRVHKTTFRRNVLWYTSQNIHTVIQTLSEIPTSFITGENGNSTYQFVININFADDVNF
jgi:hypothetical protein